MYAALDPKLTWYVSRASGLVTWTLCAAAILWGLVLSSKLIRRRGLPAWLLDLHRYLGTLALVFCGIHVTALVADSYVHFSWREVLLPMASQWRPGAVAWGVVSMYLLIAIQVTSALRSRISKRVWHTIHLSSFLLFGAGSIHGIRSGADWTNRFVQYGAVSVIGLVIFATAVRLTFRPKARPAIRPVEPVDPVIRQPVGTPVFETHGFEAPQGVPR